MTRRLGVLAVLVAAATAGCGDGDARLTAAEGPVEVAVGETVVVDDAALFDAQAEIDALVEEYQARPGIRDVAHVPAEVRTTLDPEQLERWSDGTAVELFLASDVDPSAIQAIGAELDAEEHVVDVELVDQAAQYEQFRSYYEDTPEVLEGVEPSDLPPSFRVSFGGGREIRVEEVDGALTIEGVEPGEVTLLVVDDGDVIELDVVVIAEDDEQA